jgi:hypothetical protein
MMNPRKVAKLIEETEVGYTLGNAIRAIIYAKDPNQDENKRLQHLKDARLFLNDEIKRLSKKK